MKIVGFQKLSTVDYPKNLCSTIFLGGCNMNCSFCHNRRTALEENSQREYSASKVLEFLQRRKGLIEAVCISGGEPTIHKDLKDFIKKIKEMGYKVKLDTNGSRPDVVRTLIDEKLVDYIAMDIKAPWSRYEEVCGCIVDLDKIKETVQLIRKSGIKYEFRTTFIPEMSVDDIRQIASNIEGAEKYVLQQYRKPEAGRDVFGVGKLPHDKEYVIKAAEEVHGLFESCEIRGIGAY